MKNLYLTMTDEILNDYVLTVDEMICVKGGDPGEPIFMPSVPPVKI